MKNELLFFFGAKFQSCRTILDQRQFFFTTERVLFCLCCVRMP
uniref:Uncharacterized protein n=1 Tax=Anguilla anguilla TaxID=7936 RepID=A0A0E9U5E3_ANGAN